jgi:hypothetical protein
MAFVGCFCSYQLGRVDRGLLVTEWSAVGLVAHLKSGAPRTLRDVRAHRGKAQRGSSIILDEIGERGSIQSSVHRASCDDAGKV